MEEIGQQPTRTLGAEASWAAVNDPLSQPLHVLGMQVM